jgi:hypothetical protein
MSSKNHGGIISAEKDVDRLSATDLSEGGDEHGTKISRFRGTSKVRGMDTTAPDPDSVTPRYIFDGVAHRPD